MNIKTLKISELKPYKNNPRKNEEAVEQVANSIKEFGFKVPIIVDKDYNVVAGHTRLKALQKLGINEVECVIADDLNKQQVKALRLADNKVSEKAQWDFNLLDSELADIFDIDMSKFGFDDLINEGDFGTDFELPSGSKAPFMQITFTLANEQAEEIKDILNYAKKKNDLMNSYDNYGNENNNGNALYVVVKEWEKQKR